MKLSSNRSKNINAYCAPVVVYSGEIQTQLAIYPTPDPGQEDLAHRKKFHTGTVDESKLKDGWYYWKEANYQSSRISSGLIHVHSGEIVEECSTVDEMKQIEAARRFPGLPPLIGSPKQVAYAESLRAKYLFQIWELGILNSKGSATCEMLATSPKDAKWWIEAGSYTPLRDWLLTAIAVSSITN